MAKMRPQKTCKSTDGSFASFPLSTAQMRAQRVRVRRWKTRPRRRTTQEASGRPGPTAFFRDHRTREGFRRGQLLSQRMCADLQEEFGLAVGSRSSAVGCPAKRRSDDSILATSALPVLMVSIGAFLGCFIQHKVHSAPATEQRGETRGASRGAVLLLLRGRLPLVQPLLVNDKPRTVIQRQRDSLKRFSRCTCEKREDASIDFTRGRSSPAPSGPWQSSGVQAAPMSEISIKWKRKRTKRSQRTFLGLCVTLALPLLIFFKIANSFRPVARQRA